MFQAFGVTGIGQGAIESVEQAEAAVDFAQEQGTGVGRKGAAGEIGFEASGIQTGKAEGVGVTLCHRGGPLRVTFVLC